MEVFSEFWFVLIEWFLIFFRICLKQTSVHVYQNIPRQNLVPLGCATSSPLSQANLSSKPKGMHCQTYEVDLTLAFVDFANRMIFIEKMYKPNSSFLWILNKSR